MATTNTCRPGGFRLAHVGSVCERTLALLALLLTVGCTQSATEGPAILLGDTNDGLVDTSDGALAVIDAQEVQADEATEPPRSCGEIRAALVALQEDNAACNEDADCYVVPIEDGPRLLGRGQCDFRDNTTSDCCELRVLYPAESFPSQNSSCGTLFNRQTMSSTVVFELLREWQECGMSCGEGGCTFADINYTVYREVWCADDGLCHTRSWVQLGDGDELCEPPCELCDNGNPPPCLCDDGSAPPCLCDDGSLPPCLCNDGSAPPCEVPPVP